MGQVRRLVIAILFSLLPLLGWAEKFPDLALTPPMGWNSWNHFDCDIDETLIKETADALVSTGLRDSGFVYVNLDDCWHGERDAQGWIQADPDRFPSGIKALADYVHARGLKLGIYSDAGTKTCKGKPGSQGYEYQDALQYARWEVDYLKYDWCNTGEGKAQRNPIEAYTTMREALAAAGRPIVFSICEWGTSEPWTWAKDIGHLWRTSGDITNCWNCTLGHGTWQSWGVLPILDKQFVLRGAAGPGHWNDPDMLEFGNLPTLSENRAHFVMWAMLAAPLILGTDVRTLTQAQLAILNNARLIAVNQDPLGVQAYRHKAGDGLESWIKPLSNGEYAIAFLNRGDTRLKEQYAFADQKWTDRLSDASVDFSLETFDIEDLLSGESAGDTRRPLKLNVGPRDVAIYRLGRRAARQ